MEKITELCSVTYFFHQWLSQTNAVPVPERHSEAPTKVHTVWLECHVSSKWRRTLWGFPRPHVLCLPFVCGRTLAKE